MNIYTHKECTQFNNFDRLLKQSTNIILWKPSWKQCQQEQCSVINLNMK
jgi:hypothetical protein